MLVYLLDETQVYIIERFKYFQSEVEDHRDKRIICIRCDLGGKYEAVEVISQQAPPNTRDKVVMVEVHTSATKVQEVPAEVCASVFGTREAYPLPTTGEEGRDASEIPLEIALGSSDPPRLQR